MAKLRSPIFWILILAAVLRFVQIDSPPVGRHAWRQSDTASVARNFHRYDHGFLYPQIDWEIPGFVEMELPIYPWTASLIYQITGETEAAARMLSILGSLLTIWFLYLIVLRILGRRTAGLFTRRTGDYSRAGAGTARQVGRRCEGPDPSIQDLDGD